MHVPQTPPWSVTLSYSSRQRQPRMDLSDFSSFCSDRFTPSNILSPLIYLPSPFNLSPPFLPHSLMTVSLPWPFPRSTDTEKPTPSLKRSPSALLHYYATPGVPPPSARLDPSLKQRESQPIRIWDLWRYGLIAASKGPYFTHQLHPLLMNDVYQPLKSLVMSSHIISGDHVRSLGVLK
jgi:hypothetical protein